MPQEHPGDDEILAAYSDHLSQCSNLLPDARLIER